MAARTHTVVLERGVDGSTVTSSELPGGLRVVTESVPGARSASVGVWVGVGSVDETPRLAGASHYLEHLLFKGTRYRSGYEIADAVDAVGGELNAFTSHEYTCFYARILADEAKLAIGLVCEVVLDATIAAADVDTERMVISDLIYGAAQPAGWALIEEPTDKERRFLDKLGIDLIEESLHDLMSETPVESCA